MEIKILAKNTILLAGPKVLKFLLGILRSKLIAVYLGATGAGIISQLQQTIQQISTFTLSSVPEGMIKLIAKQNSLGYSSEKINKIFKAYFLITIPLTILVTIFGFIFADKITIYVFGDIQYKLYFQIGFISFPILILIATITSVLTAFKEIKSISYAGMLIILLNFIVFVPLIYFYRITGGVIYVTISYFITFFVLYYFLRKNIIVKHEISVDGIIQANISKKYLKELMAFMGFGLVAGTYYIFTEVSTRAIVVTQLGIEKLGIYAPITAWGGLFVGFILPSLSTYLFPRISESKDDADIINVVNDVIRLTTFLTLPFIIMGISLRLWIIPLFYSVEFLEASIYLPFHFGALLFTIWTFSFTSLFAPTGRLKSFLVTAIIIHSLSLGLVYFLVPEYGLYGYLSKFTITPLFSFILYLLYWIHEIKFSFKKENKNIIIYSICTIILLILLRDKLIILQIVALILLLGLPLFLKKEEKQFIISKIKSVR